MDKIVDCVLLHNGDVFSLTDLARRCRVPKNQAKEVIDQFIKEHKLSCNLVNGKYMYRARIVPFIHRIRLANYEPPRPEEYKYVNRWLNP